MKTLVLGSQSPRRKALLEMAGASPLIRPSYADEMLDHAMPAEEAAAFLAEQKSVAVQLNEKEVLLTSDTVVSIDGDLLGKPADTGEARRMLETMSGRTHQVYTAVCLRTLEEKRTFTTGTDVSFYTLTDEEIDHYLNTKEAWDKAGGYGIQGKGGLFVKEIKGDYYNVVGLPIARVIRELRAFGIFIH
ncbi:septum formation inhibitor Maf [Halobacillus kuroshimensis]|uniref:dTTP/UTP pyrophosphatase n=1 Tax=Halobacillus kuroshimensis TaxID=302481 RepID=A0ABS3DZJ8_9BACI|nr:Maf family protein [Halobacillus kuroshimensis]MBN8236780.1 septum formation inhibitor Maf [Halobacillus kuroshimensis]